MLSTTPKKVEAFLMLNARQDDVVGLEVKATNYLG